jgi:hypothetical protein
LILDNSRCLIRLGKEKTITPENADSVFAIQNPYGEGIVSFAAKNFLPLNGAESWAAWKTLNDGLGYSHKTKFADFRR